VRVLAVGAHPDDLEILCAGTLLRYVQDSHDVVMCNVAAGDKGSTTHAQDEISAIRLQEARRSAEIAGAEHRTLGIPDCEVSAADPEQRLQMVELIREARPEMILTHHPADYMGDHREVSALVFAAGVDATLSLLRTASPHHDVIAPPLYYMDTLAGVGFSPTEYVDISDVIETKLEMLAAHESQVRFLGGREDVSIRDDTRTASRFRGMQAGVRYAEGFVQCQTWLRGTTRRLLP
jgi:LmbE family N-acetylglucosaminyl deacetylase